MRAARTPAGAAGARHALSPRRLLRRALDVLTPVGRGRLALWWRGDDVLQPETYTRLDRHPALFRMLAQRLAQVPEPRILSVGCATGEEAFTLAGYLPRARIEATDVNPGCIAVARRRLRERGGGTIRFHCAAWPDRDRWEPQDAVLCLSVLRHARLDAERPASSAAILPFARYAAMIDALDACLRPGGTLILWGSNFRFADTAVSGRYREVSVPDQRPHRGAFYGPDDRLTALASDNSFMFEKLR